MSNCLGEISVATKVDRDMIEFLESEEEKLATSRSEIIRRCLDHYREGVSGELDCPYCENELKVKL